jgi:hypothetical protein
MHSLALITVYSSSNHYGLLQHESVAVLKAHNSQCYLCISLHADIDRVHAHVQHVCLQVHADARKAELKLYHDKSQSTIATNSDCSGIHECTIATTGGRSHSTQSLPSFLLQKQGVTEHTPLR